MQRNEHDNAVVKGLPEDLDKLTLAAITQPSILGDADIQKQNEKILEAFNKDNKQDISVESVIFGKRIDQDEFRLIHRNNVPQLLPYTYYPRRLGIYFTGVTQEMGVFKQTDLLIGGHGRYLINVPQGKLVRAWLGTNHPIFLGEGPHVIRHPNFKIEKEAVVDISQAYISHGNYKVLRVPRGQVAKIWLGSTPYILESRPEPYVFNDPTFRIMTTVENNHTQYFTSASERLIEHGSIKRLLPRTGEVAIAYDSGNLKIINASGEPITVNSDTFIVDGFLQTAAQTLVFPSKKTQEERRKEKQSENFNYEEFRTNDGLPIGVNLLVVYEIINPEVTLTRLKKDDIINHIENIVVADMGRVIQSCSSSDFQKTDQTVVKDPTKLQGDNNFELRSKPTFYAHLQDDVKNKLAEDLMDWGIRLVRLNIETPKILDKTIANEMAKNSLVTAKARADASTLGLDYTIKQQRANQEAEKMRIEMERERDNKVLQADGDAKSITMRAQAELEMTKLQAEAERIKYENEVRKTKMLNETGVAKAQLETDVALGRKKREYDYEVDYLERKAKLFGENPDFRQLELAKAQATALSGIRTTVISPDVAQSWYAGGMGLFTPMVAAQRREAVLGADANATESEDKVVTLRQ